MNNIKMVPFIISDIQQHKAQRKTSQLPNNNNAPLETPNQFRNDPNRTEQTKNHNNISPNQEQDKSKTAIKLPLINKKQPDNFSDREDNFGERKQNELQTEERRMQNNPLLKMYANRRSTDKIGNQEDNGFLSIVGVKPTVRSTQKMPNKDINHSLGHDRFERGLLKEKGQGQAKNQEEKDGSLLQIKQRRRRVSTNCKSSIIQKIESSSHPKKTVPLSLNQKKKSTLILRVERPKSSPNYYEWSLLLGLIDGVVCEKESGPTYKAFVGKGNNSILVKSIIKARPWWTLSQEENDSHLVWSQGKNQKLLDTFKEGVQQQPFEWDKQVKARLTIFGNIGNLINDKIKGHINQGFYRLLTPAERQIQCKSSTSVALVYPQTYRIIDPVKAKIHNHLQFHWHLTNKKALYYNMKSYYEAIGSNPFENIPETYHVQKEGDEEWGRFTKGLEKKGLWIIKPGENSNQGCGIDVVQTLEEVREIVRTKSTRDNGKPRSHIIQKYLMPFLYNKRKFDIRCYIVVSSLNGNLRCYWYEEGYIRTASKEFTTKNLKNRMIHLTNDAVQKHSQFYGKHENANKLSFTQFQKYVKNTKPEHDFFQECYPRMIQLATDIVRATYQVIDAKHRDFTFQVFGLDFMIDENFNTWLIEVNTNPCLELCCPLLARLIPSMLENAFRIAVDPLFPPPKDHPRHKGMTEDLFESNRFNLIFSSKEEIELSKVLCPKKLDNIIESDQESDCGDECELKEE